jgi:hypothetical protein
VRPTPRLWYLLSGSLVLAGVLGLGVGDHDDKPERSLTGHSAQAPAPAAPLAVVAGSPSPRRTSPTPAPVVQRGDGRPAVVAGSSPRRGTGPLLRFTVAVEGGLRTDPRDFAVAVERTLSDPRSWGSGGRHSWQRVSSGPVDLRVVLASPDTTDRLCRPLDTGGSYSCANGDLAVINMYRWTRGAAAYKGDLRGYRQYVVNHEVGHTLGRGHVGCPGRGELAPVMMQQTKGIGACRKSPWPFP